MEKTFKARGKIQYMLKGRDGSTKRANQPWVIVKVPESIAFYYRAQIQRNLINPFQQEPVPNQDGDLEIVPDRIHPPKWGAHITVLDGRFSVPTNKMQNWGKHDGETVDFEYSPIVHQVWKFFVLPVKSPKLDTIREELGLDPHPLHITVGRLE